MNEKRNIGALLAEHKAASLLRTVSDRSSLFYLSYPSKQSKIPSGELKRGYSAVSMDVLTINYGSNLQSKAKLPVSTKRCDLSHDLAIRNIYLRSGVEETSSRREKWPHQ